MLDVVIGGFLLTGSVCIQDRPAQHSCRDIPATEFGSRYSCDDQLAALLERFPKVTAVQLGYPEGERLTVNLRCSAMGGRS